MNLQVVSKQQMVDQMMHAPATAQTGMRDCMHEISSCAFWRKPQGNSKHTKGEAHLPSTLFVLVFIIFLRSPIELMLVRLFSLSSVFCIVYFCRLHNNLVCIEA